MNEIYLYPYSFGDAKSRGELDLWRESHKANVACKDAIEEAIRQNFDGMHLKADCAKSVVAEYGYKRTNWVLANTVQQKDWDGRFSQENKEWARQTYIPSDKDNYHNRNLYFLVESHPAVLDGFVNQYRRAFAELGMFDHTHCEVDSKEQDYKGKVLVLLGDVLREGCQSPKDQLWLAQGGFGCDPDAIGRSIHCVCLSDGEVTRWNRHDFIGVLKEELLPDWAREKLVQLESPAQDSPEMNQQM